jgi:dolichol-phosphate mannosyltransferase
MSPPRVAPPLVSLVFPVLDEEDNAVAMVARFHDVVARNPAFDFELVVIDDGSTDRTVALVQDAMAPDDRFVVVELARNFGSHYAVSAGLRYANGDCAIVLGADLQEPPSLVTEMLERWVGAPGRVGDDPGDAMGYDIVWGVRAERARVSLLGGLFSRAFSKLFHRYSDLKSYPAEGPSGVLCSRAVIDVVNGMPERHRNVLGLIAWSGYRQTTIRYSQLARQAGESKWTTKKLVKLAIDSFVQFSFAPIRFMTWIGSVIATLGFLYGFVLVVAALLGNQPPTGWTTVMVVILILGGFQLLMLGVLGEYLWRAADESRQRPLFIVRRVSGPARPGPGRPAAPARTGDAVSAG